MLLILSDSHTDRAVVEALKVEYAGKVSAIFHCGDSELPAADTVWQGVTVVAGNCDYDEDYADSQLTEIDGKRILLTHGHLQAVNLFGLSAFNQEAEQAAADIVLFGHIHRPVAEVIDKRLYLNPGSVAKPRGDWQIKMYALLDWKTLPTHTIYKISFRDLAHQPIAHLQFTLEVGK